MADIRAGVMTLASLAMSPEKTESLASETITGAGPGWRAALSATTPLPFNPDMSVAGFNDRPPTVNSMAAVPSAAWLSADKSAPSLNFPSRETPPASLVKSAIAVIVPPAARPLTSVREIFPGESLALIVLSRIPRLSVSITAPLRTVTSPVTWPSASSSNAASGQTDWNCSVFASLSAAGRL